VCFYFFPVGSGVDVSNEIKWATSMISTYPSMRKSRRTLDVDFIWLSTNKASSPLSEPMISKYFKTYYFATHDSTVFYR
jgi:hypothetical protein